MCLGKYLIRKISRSSFRTELSSNVVVVLFCFLFVCLFVKMLSTYMNLEGY